MAKNVVQTLKITKQEVERLRKGEAVELCSGANIMSEPLYVRIKPQAEKGD